jgi:hypothetical protein
MRYDDPAAFRRSNARKSRPVSLLAIAAMTRGALSLGLAGLFFIAFAALSSPASAHGRLGAAAGRCRLFIGPDIMNFTGYTPDSSKNEFCEDIPTTGHMIMVLDEEQAELRDMAVEIRIVKDVGGEANENEDLEAVTVAYRQPKLYPTGTINFEHNFKKAGFFIGIVTVTGDHGERWVSRFPFSVGMSFVRTLPVYLVISAGVLFAMFIYLRRRKATPPPPLKTTPDPAPTPAE